MDPHGSDTTRVHLVLVPGFGGFDALGQLEYYSGATASFREWQKGDARRGRAVLHYFDNLPTAGVVTRAHRLHAYLATRFARGEIQRQDQVVLVGHSTGGLDLRRLLLDLAEGPDLAVDGGSVHRGKSAKRGVVVSNRDLLEVLRKLVFLSVPQRGTNVADWVRGHSALRRVATRGLRAAVDLQALRPLGWLEQHAASTGGLLTRAQLLYAARDALREADAESAEHRSAGWFVSRRRRLEAAERASSAREAWAELLLWVRGIDRDFAAIDDLVARRPESGFFARHFSHGAHALFPSEQHERALWAAHGLTTRSYATVGRCPFEPSVVRSGAPWRLREAALRADPLLLRDARGDSDFPYRWCYRATAGGPLKDMLAPARATPLQGGPARTLEPWENDGIVNTLSMLWPDGEDTRLVEGDHGDIIGHFEAQRAARGEQRRFHSYDLFGSGSGFDAARFDAVWHGVFDFALE